MLDKLTLWASLKSIAVRQKNHYRENLWTHLTLQNCRPAISIKKSNKFDNNKMKKIKYKLLNSVLITTLTIFGLSSSLVAQKIAGGTGNNLYLCSNGTVESWGSNIYGELGNGVNGGGQQQTVPVKVSFLTDIIDIAVGGNVSFALKNDGTVWAWGANYYGQLGNGNNTDSNVPVKVNLLNGIIAISVKSSHCLALKNDGTVWSWGNNNAGQLGNGSKVNTNIPLQIITLNGIIAIAAGGNHSFAIKNDGTVWAWGRNSQGQLGMGTFTEWYLTPVQVSALTNITAISLLDHSSLALKGDGTMLSWGDNTYGQLGIGSFTYSKVPVPITSLSGIKAIAGGFYHSIALKNDGTLQTWGSNSSGELGNGTYTNSNVPVQVSSLTRVTSISGGISHSLAIKDNSTAMTWGGNGSGQLGIGSYTDSNVPMLVKGLCSSVSAIEENLIENLIFVYPNPSSGIFQLNFDNMQLAKEELEIYNVSGEKVYTVANIKQQMQIDLSALPTGIYFVKVYDGTKIYNQKIVVQ